MSRILEALTRPHDQVTGIDELIMLGLAVAGIAVLFVILALIFGRDS